MRKINLSREFLTRHDVSPFIQVDIHLASKNLQSFHLHQLYLKLCRYGGSIKGIYTMKILKDFWEKDLFSQLKFEGDEAYVVNRMSYQNLCRYMRQLSEKGFLIKTGVRSGKGKNMLRYSVVGQGKKVVSDNLDYPLSFTLESYLKDAENRRIFEARRTQYKPYKTHLVKIPIEVIYGASDDFRSTILKEFLDIHRVQTDWYYHGIRGEGNERPAYLEIREREADIVNIETGEATRTCYEVAHVSQYTGPQKYETPYSNNQMSRKVLNNTPRMEGVECEYLAFNDSVYTIQEEIKKIKNKKEKVHKILDSDGGEITPAKKCGFADTITFSRAIRNGENTSKKSVFVSLSYMARMFGCSKSAVASMVKYAVKKGFFGSTNHLYTVGDNDPLLLQDLQNVNQSNLPPEARFSAVSMPGEKLVTSLKKERGIKRKGEMPDTMIHAEYVPLEVINEYFSQSAIVRPAGSYKDRPFKLDEDFKKLIMLSKNAEKNVPESLIVLSGCREFILPDCKRAVLGEKPDYIKLRNKTPLC